MEEMVKVEFMVDEKALPALYSAFEEISNEVGGRLESKWRFTKQEALTQAAIGLGAVRKGLAETMAKLSTRWPKDTRWQSPLGDPEYR